MKKSSNAVWYEYERRKSQLERKGLTAEEYERELRKIRRELRL